MSGTPIAGETSGETVSGTSGPTPIDNEARGVSGTPAADGGVSGSPLSAEETPSGIPLDGNGEPMYESVDVAVALDDLLNNQGLTAEEAAAYVANRHTDAQARYDELQANPPKMGSSVAEYRQAKAQWQSEVGAAEGSLMFWSSADYVMQQRIAVAETEPITEPISEPIVEEADEPQPIGRGGSRDARPVKRRRASLSAQISRMADKYGEPSDLRNFVLKALLCGGYKFRWSDKGNGTRGLASHLGLRGRAEMAQRLWLLNSGGLSPEAVAERLEAEFGRDEVSTADVLNEILDILRSTPSRQGMYEELRDYYDSLALENDAEARQAAEDRELAEDLAEARGFASVEEMEAYEEVVYAELEEAGMTDAEYEKYSNFVAEQILKEENERRNEAAQSDEQNGDNGVRQGGGEILSEPQVDDDRGDETVAGRPAAADVSDDNADGASQAGQDGEVAEGLTDSQGNPVDAEGRLVLEEITSIDQLTDEDFTRPTRSVRLPALPGNVDNAIGANGKAVIIKKNIFEKNAKAHKDLTPDDSRLILSQTLYAANLYGQNRKTSRPYNWILVHLADKNTAVIIEVNGNKEYLEIVNWHYLNEKQLNQKRSQAEREGGLILALESAAGNTSNGLTSEGEVTQTSADTQASTAKKPINNLSELRAKALERGADPEWLDRYERMPLTVLRKQAKIYEETLRKVSPALGTRLQAEHDYVRALIAEQERNKKYNKWGVKVGNTATPFEKVRAMFEEWNSDADVAALMDKVAPIFEKLPVKIMFSDTLGGSSAQGSYNAAKGELKLAGLFVYSELMSNQSKAQAILHEMIHAVTSYALYVDEKPALQSVIGMSLSPEMRKAVDTLRLIFSRIKTDPAFRGEYGSTDVHEMVAELSNPGFRAKLREKGLWQQVVDAIKRLLGIEVKNALDGAEGALQKMLDNFDRTQWDKLVAVGRKHASMADGLADRMFIGEQGASELDSSEMVTEEVNITPLLNVVKTLYEKGKEFASKLFQRRYFDVAITPDFMKRLGLRGDKFTVKYGVIARHIGKDGSHDLSEKDWERLPQALQTPFAITKLNDKKDSYRIYTTLRTEKGEYVVVGVDVKNAGRELEVNAISTVFGRRNNANLSANEEVIYKDKNITPNQSSLLERPNLAQYPINQELPADKVSDNFSDTQEGMSDVLARPGDVFYSNAERAVLNIKQEKATPQQWLAMIEKQGGLKAGEDKWLGLSDWLKGSDAKTLTKQEVLDYIAQNQIVVEEVRYKQGLVADYGVAEYIYEGFEEIYNELRDNNNDLDHFELVDYAWSVYCDQSPSWINEAIEAVAYSDGTWDLRIVDSYVYENHATEDAGINSINSIRMKYTTEGLENNKEIALVVPTVEPYNQSDEIHFGDAGEGRAVAWVRFGEARDAEGNHVLVIDEIQSKRHQDGREKGYRDTNTSNQIEEAKKSVAEAERVFAEFRKEMQEKHDYNSLVQGTAEGRRAGLRNWKLRFTPEEMIKYDQLHDATIDARNALEEARQAHSKVPDAPFDKNWHELAMKRMLRYAAENGFNKVAWTTGAQQAERYNIGKQVDEIRIYDIYDRQYNVVGFKDGQRVFSADTENGEQGLAEVLGKEMAREAYSNFREGKTEYLNEDGTVSFKGDNLRIGGEGMKGFYDKMLPSFMNKYGKRWGVKVGEVTMPNLQEGYQTMHSIDVTAEMRASVMEGQPLFRPGEWMLDPTQEVEIVETEPHSFKNFAEARVWAKDNIVGTYINPEIGEVNVSGKAIDKYLSGKAVGKSGSLDAHLSALTVLPRLIETSAVGEIHEDRDGNENLKDVVRLFGAITINGETSRVKITVKRYNDTNQANKAYSYEVTEIEPLDGTLGTTHTQGADFVPTSNNSIALANLLQGVEKSNTPGEFLLDNARVEGASFADVAVAAGDKLGVKVVVDPTMGSKGSYNLSTGEVRVNPNAHLTEADVERTVVHEVIGHGGMQALLGERFDEICANVYAHMSEEQRADIRRRHGKELSNAEVGAEYMAETAERMASGEQVTSKLRQLWERVKGWIRDAVRRRGIAVAMSDADIRYMIATASRKAREGKLQEMIDHAVETRRLRGAAMSHDVMESQLSQPLMRPGDSEDASQLASGVAGLTDAEYVQQMQLEEVARRVAGRWGRQNKKNRRVRLRTNMIDASHPIHKVLQQMYGLEKLDDVEKTLGYGERNAYMMRERAASRAADRVLVFRRQVLAPLNSMRTDFVKALAEEFGIKLSEALALSKVYFAAKTGLERQRVKEETAEDGAEDRDYAGLGGSMIWLGALLRRWNGAELPPIDWVAEAERRGYKDTKTKGWKKGTSAVAKLTENRAAVEETLAAHGYPTLEEWVEYVDGLSIEAAAAKGDIGMSRFGTADMWSIIQGVSRTMLEGQVKAGLLSAEGYQRLAFGDTFANIIWRKELAAFFSGTHHGVLHLGATSPVLMACGLNPQTLYITSKTLRTHVNKHGLTADDLMDLPEALRNPLMVYEWGTKAKSLVIITELQRGRQRITVAVKLERGGEILEVNEVASVHGKDASRFLDDMKNAHAGGFAVALRWVSDKKDVLHWLGIAPPKGAAPQTDEELIAKVITDFTNPDFTSVKLPKNGINYWTDSRQLVENGYMTEEVASKKTA